MAGTVSLTATILDNQVLATDVPWTEGMTLLGAMEYARGESNFSFLVSYYGPELGYLLHELNDVGDQPRVYWLVAVNGETQHTGLDKVDLNDGDAVTVTFSYWAGADAEQNPKAQV
jgi:hypothetical protein